MEVFLIAALVGVLLFGIPTAILIGRASRPKTVQQPQQTTATGGNPPAVVTTSTTKTTMHVGNQAGFIGLIVFIFLLALLWGALKYFGLLPSELNWNWLEILQGLLVVLLVIAFVALLIYVKDFRAIGLNLLTVAIIGLALAGLFGFDNILSGFRSAGTHFANFMGGGVNLSGSDFRTVTNGFVRLPRGGNDVFYVQGAVRIQNFEDYCLNISPEEMFNISWSGDVRVIYLVPKSGGKELVSVESKPISRCRSS